MYCLLCWAHLAVLCMEPLAKTFLESNYPVESVAYSYDGSYIIAGTYNDNKLNNSPIKVWKRNAKNSCLADGINTGPVVALATDPRELKYATGDHDKIKMWDIEKGACIREMQDNVPVTAVDYSKEGNLILAGYKDGVIKIWDIREKETLQAGAFYGHEGAIHAVKWHPVEPEHFATCAADDTVKIWDSRRDYAYYSLKDRDGQLKIAYAENGNKLLACSSHIKVYDASSTALLAVYNLEGKKESPRGSKISAALSNAPEKKVSAIALAINPAPNQQTIFAASIDDGNLLLADLSGNQPAKLIRASTSNKNASHEAGSLTFSPNGQELAFGSYTEKGVRIWDCKTLLAQEAKVKRKEKKEECSLF